MGEEKLTAPEQPSAIRPPEAAAFWSAEKLQVRRLVTRAEATIAAALTPAPAGTKGSAPTSRAKAPIEVRTCRCPDVRISPPAPLA